MALVKGPPQPLTYRAAGALPPLGSRVRVPLGPRKLMGYVVAHGAEVPDGIKLKSASEPLDDSPAIGAELLALASRLAAYYMASLGSVLNAALPPAASGGRMTARQVRVATLAITDEAAEALATQLEPRAPRQAEALRALLDHGPLPCARLPQGTVPKLAERGALTVDQQALIRSPLALENSETLAPITLTLPQQMALDAVLKARGSFAPFLLHGVTGSGKTEVYLQAAQAIINGGGQVLLLTPEIALASTLTLAARHRFGDRVALLHSGLSDGERRDEWRRIHGTRNGQCEAEGAPVDLVIGTRSAVFAPLSNLQLIVVDEEHDGAYKQEESPRYHGRDAALMRAQALNIPILMGSATPALESHYRASKGIWGYLQLPERVQAAQLPKVQLVNLTETRPARDGGLLTAPLLNALVDTVGRGEQALLFLNRRGFAPSLLCAACGHTYECNRCKVSLTYHKGARRLHCHYCDDRYPVPSCCDECGNRMLTPLGLGTEGLEAELAAVLPEARVVRMDRDSTRGKNAHVKILREMEQGKIDVLVGTQMIAKGHHLPGVTLVGVVCADQGIHVPDFRAAEHSFALLTQVAGRAGRGEKPGRVVLQAYEPEHPSIQHALTHDYAAFMAGELAMREALGYPPAGRVVRLVLRDARLSRLEAACAALTDLISQRPASEVEVLGPAPPALAMLRGEHRRHLLIKGREVGPLRQLTRWLLDGMAALPASQRVRIDIDIDPQSLL